MSLRDDYCCRGIFIEAEIGAKTKRAVTGGLTILVSDGLLHNDVWNATR